MYSKNGQIYRVLFNIVETAKMETAPRIPSISYQRRLGENIEKSNHCAEMDDGSVGLEYILCESVDLETASGTVYFIKAVRVSRTGGL